ncbi:MAG: molybdopterin molybdotransferase MoeA [Sphingopyxis sp.]
MISVDEAHALIAANATKLTEETVALDNALGRVLAASVVAALDSPRQAVSAMDGYAVRDADVSGVGARLAVIGESFAGAGFDGRIDVGQGVRIFTGAPLPDGTDRVICQENIDREGDVAIVARDYGPGWHVRGRASDFAAGAVLLEAGTLLTPRALVAAAAADVASLVVSCRARVAIIATGDELAPPGSAREQRFAIPESVSIGVAAAARAWSGDVVSRVMAGDDFDALVHVAGEALATADLVICTGGASVGDHDYAKAMFEPHGLSLIFSKVAMKPGKPVWLGRAGDRLVLGLPGNPTSAMVTARLFLAPLLAAMQGRSMEDALMWRALPLAVALPAAGERESFIRAQWGADGLIPMANQDSGSQRALVDADWLIRCPAGQAAQSAGALVQALLF